MSQEEHSEEEQGEGTPRSSEEGNQEEEEQDRAGPAKASPIRVVICLLLLFFLGKTWKCNVYIRHTVEYVSSAHGRGTLGCGVGAKMRSAAHMACSIRRHPEKAGIFDKSLFLL